MALTVNLNLNFLEELKQLYNQQLSLSQTLQQGQEFFLQYEHMKDLSFSYDEIEKYIFQLPTILEEKKQLNLQSSILLEKLNELKFHKSELDNAVSNIRSYGKKFIDTVKNFKACPLCGNENITSDEFRAFIVKEFQEQDNMLYIIQSDYDETLKNILKLDNAENSINRIQLLKDSIDRAYKKCDIDNNQPFSDPLEIIKKKLQLHEKQRIDFQLVQSKYSQYFSQLETINQSFSKSRYANNYNQLIFDIEAAMPSWESIDNITTKQKLEKLILYTENQYMFLEYNISVLKSKCQEKEKWIKIIEEQLNKVTKSMHDIETQINQDKNERLILDRLNKFFAHVIPLLQDNVLEISHTQLSNQCDVLLDRFVSFQKAEEVFSQTSKIERKIKDLENQTHFTKIAIEKLSQLKPSSEYAQRFIEHHISHISNIFCCLHMPKEFDNLILENGKIAGKRKQEIVFINQMSTGQKTAVALSVFLTLNSAIKTAPQIILIDEPAANIDDLNILSLMDFLREMVISNNKQIFFTTASYNVRRLFRRKFSFLEKEFIEFSFDRTANLKTTITINQYNQSGTIHPKKEIIFTD